VKLVQGRAAPETPCLHRPEKPRSGLSQVGGQERYVVTVTVIEVIGWRTNETTRPWTCCQVASAEVGHRPARRWALPPSKLLTGHGNGKNGHSYLKSSRLWRAGDLPAEPTGWPHLDSGSRGGGQAAWGCAVSMAGAAWGRFGALPLSHPDVWPDGL